MWRRSMARRALGSLPQRRRATQRHDQRLPERHGSMRQRQKLDADASQTSEELRGCRCGTACARVALQCTTALRTGQYLLRVRDVGWNMLIESVTQQQYVCAAI